jgi:hypothetical protein
MIEMLKPYYRKIRRQVLIALLVHAYVSRTGMSISTAMLLVNQEISMVEVFEALLDTNS